MRIEKDGSGVVWAILSSKQIYAHASASLKVSWCRKSMHALTVVVEEFDVVVNKKYIVGKFLNLKCCIMICRLLLSATLICSIPINVRQAEFE